jgi:hypothetical protein
MHRSTMREEQRVENARSIINERSPGTVKESPGG